MNYSHEARCFGKTYEKEKCLLRPCPLTTDEVVKAFSIEQPMIDPGTQIEYFTDEGFKRSQSIADSRKKRSGDGNVEKWTDGIVPYILDDSLKDDDRLVFARAISEISLHTCIQFVNILPLDYTEDVETESPYILVERDCDCDGLIPCTGGGRTDGLGVESPRRLIISTGCHLLLQMMLAWSFMSYSMLLESFILNKDLIEMTSSL